jgi:hypothetical protein
MKKSFSITLIRWEVKYIGMERAGEKCDVIYVLHYM